MNMHGMVAMVCSVAALALLAPAAQGQDDGVTAGALRAKGAKMLGKEELEALLPGSVLEDQNDQHERRFHNAKDGDLDVNFRPRFGEGVSNPAFTLSGKWRVSDQGQYCWEYRSRTNEYKGCGYIWVAGNDQFLTFGRGEQSKGKPVKIKK